jgi:hypothetical protein
MFGIRIDSFWNWDLAKEPMNWAIVFVVATIWLLLFHVIMTAYTAMTLPAAQQAVGGPGQVASPTASSAGYSAQGTLSASPPQIPGLFTGGGTQVWTDGTESKYAEDGWTAAY